MSRDETGGEMMPKLSFESFPGFAEALAKASPTARAVRGGWIVTSDEAREFMRLAGLLLETKPASGHFVELDGAILPVGPVRRPIETLAEASAGGLVFSLVNVPVGSSDHRVEGRVLTAFGGAFTDFQKDALAALELEGFERLRLHVRRGNAEIFHDALVLRTGDEEETRSAMNAAYIDWKAASEISEPPAAGDDELGGAMIDDEIPDFDERRAAR
jgi:hypothetical protein